MKEAYGYGTTIEDAKKNALTKLNASFFSEVNFEIIQVPIKKKFGLFGGCDAKVRAYTDDERTVLDIAKDYWGKYYPLFKKYWGTIYYTKTNNILSEALKTQATNGLLDVIRYRMGNTFYQKFLFFINHIDEKSLAEQSNVKRFIEKESQKHNPTLEEEAEMQGLTIEQFTQLNAVEFENYELHRQIEKETYESNYQKWKDFTESIQLSYPIFDLRKELLNPVFVKLLENNIDMITAYELVHKEELLLKKTYINEHSNIYTEAECFDFIFNELKAKRDLSEEYIQKAAEDSGMSKEHLLSIYRMEDEQIIKICQQLASESADTKKEYRNFELKLFSNKDFVKMAKSVGVKLTYEIIEFDKLFSRRNKNIK